MTRNSMMRILAACALVAMPAAAQGTLGGQGFGYPAGQYSSRAAASAGALAPFDALSPVNPAAATWQRGVLFFHLEPEFRSTSVGGTNATTRVSRYPLTGVGTRIGTRGAASITASTYLDRTWETAASGLDSVGGEEVTVTTRYASSGAINDLRAAFAWAFGPSFRAGVGYHAYTGQNRLGITWDFPDNGSLGDVAQTSTLAYSGSAVSVGGEFRLVGRGAIAGYGRFGQSARLRIADTLVANGDMPSHYGVGARFDAIPGTLLAVAWERIEWTAMSGLGTTGMGVRDADRVSVGLETQGPTVGGAPSYLRAGVARRTLPFDAVGSEVRETLMSLGMGFTFTQGATSSTSIGIAVQRALRSAGSARERAWLISLGLAISP